MEIIFEQTFSSTNYNAFPSCNGKEAQKFKTKHKYKFIAAAMKFPCNRFYVGNKMKGAGVGDSRKKYKHLWK